ncbi:MAG: sugar phosphate isomerase/epimerase [Acidimicrobiales bacterium]|jgi:sugar phosphate isomerase/epimerase
MDRIDRLSVSEVTTLHSPFDSDVATYAAAGLGGIGVWESKLRGRDTHEVADVLDAAGLRVTNLVPNGNSVFPNALDPEPSDPGERTDAFLAKLPALAVLRPETVVVVTGNLPGRDPAELRRRCVTELRRVADRAGELGLTVALEPMHPCAGDDFSFVTSLATAADLVADIGHRCVGILFDMWHAGQGPDAVDELSAAVELIVGVHVADVVAPARSWADRKFPGEGELPIERFVGVLEGGGFHGSYDVEIFSDDGTFGRRFPDSLWELADEECVARATALLRELLKGI